MNKILKRIGLLAAAFASRGDMYAQYQRMNIMEEFTSAHCGPCSQANPGLLKMVDNNSEKVLLVKYQHKIPKPDPMYNQNRADVDVRAGYYSVNFNPFGALNGGELGPGNQYPNHVGYLTQSRINSLPADAAFEMVIDARLNEAKDSIQATVKVTSGTDYGDVSASSLKLHALLVEDLHFEEMPGTNGEKDFEQVVRKMYPSAMGTVLSGNWVAGTSETYIISGAVPSYVNVKGGNLKLVAFLQRDEDKVVEQAALFAISGTTGLRQVTNTSGMILYPNPAEDLLYIRSGSFTQEKVTWNIVTIDGRQIAEGSAVAHGGEAELQIPVNGLKGGVYLVRLQSGDQYWIHKFVKQ